MSTLHFPFNYLAVCDNVDAIRCITFSRISKHNYPSHKSRQIIKYKQACFYPPEFFDLLESSSFRTQRFSQAVWHFTFSLPTMVSFLAFRGPQPDRNSFPPKQVTLVPFICSEQPVPAGLGPLLCTFCHPHALQHPMAEESLCRCSGTNVTYLLAPCSRWTYRTVLNLTSNSINSEVMSWCGKFPSPL